MTTASKVKRGRKFEQVLDGARTVFLRDGFDGASVDDIAREANVSKATLYSYFPDKRLLFLEVAKVECRRQAEMAVELDDTTSPPEQVLAIAGRRITDLATSDLGQSVFRVCVAEAERFPEIGVEFYKSGPGLVRQRLIEYLQGAVARGQLVIEDIPLAAEQFAELCKADVHIRRLLFHQETAFPAKRRDWVVKGAVEMFIARYGVRDRV